MAQPRMRPRFVVVVESEVGAVMSTLRARVESCQPPLVASFSDHHGVVRIPEARRHFWSPQLDILVESIGEAPNHARVVGRFSPHPPIWLAFVFTYGVLFLLGLSGMMYAAAELSLGRTPWCLVSTVVAAAVGAFVYGATFIGQGLGADEMYELRTWLDQCLAEVRERSRPQPASPGDSAEL
jgi:hypothetical protein